MNPDPPVTSYHTGLRWLHSELMQQLNLPNASLAGERAIVGWYMRYGFSLGYRRIDLEAALSQQPALQAIAQSLTDSQIADGKPAPQYGVGATVEVIVNGRNYTYHKGVVQSVTWHYKQKAWYYILEENGRKISKRYEAQDLRLVPPAP